MKIRLSYCLNDAADLLVRIRLSKDLVMQKLKELKDRFDADSDADIDDEMIVNYSFYYYSAGHKHIEQGEYLFYDGLR